MGHAAQNEKNEETKPMPMPMPGVIKQKKYLDENNRNKIERNHLKTRMLDAIAELINRQSARLIYIQHIKHLALLQLQIQTPMQVPVQIRNVHWI